jgi:hypothetical protein
MNDQIRTPKIDVVRIDIVATDQDRGPFTFTDDVEGLAIPDVRRDGAMR